MTRPRGIHDNASAKTPLKKRGNSSGGARPRPAVTSLDVDNLFRSAVPPEVVVVGIDAGGSSTRARAVRSGLVVFDGVGGPGNPGTIPAAQLVRAYSRALESCPTPSRVAACVAGTGSAERRGQVLDMLATLLPSADIVVYPDYFAPLNASRDTDVCVIAGTGSVVCSRGSGTKVHASGGRGWILGDPGSAAWLGRAVLGHFVDQPDSFDEVTHRRLLDLYDADTPSEIVRRLHSSQAHPAALAAAAPVLSDLATSGDVWARRELYESMSRLAQSVARHIDRFTVVEHPLVGLSGGVWESPVCVEAFTVSLAAACPRASVASELIREPINGAVALALAGGAA